MSSACKSCGIGIPDNQDFCSMCYGDPYYGTDGIYLEYLRQAEEAEYWQEMERERERQEEER